MKNQQNYVNYNKKTKRFLIFAIVLVIIGLSGISVYFDSYEFSDLILALFVFIIPGCICAYTWYKRKEKLKEYKNYLQYFNSRRKIKIDDLCNKFGKDYETVNDIITEIINLGMINGYIEDDELILKGNNKIEFTEENTNKVTKIVKCKECGAKNTVIEGEKKECEYCGSVLQ